MAGLKNPNFSAKATGGTIGERGGGGRKKFEGVKGGGKNAGKRVIRKKKGTSGAWNSVKVSGQRPLEQDWLLTGGGKGLRAPGVFTQKKGGRHPKGGGLSS